MKARKNRTNKIWDEGNDAWDGSEADDSAEECLHQRMQHGQQAGGVGSDCASG